jgi:hypothetical protein
MKQIFLNSTVVSFPHSAILAWRSQNVQTTYKLSNTKKGLEPLLLKGSVIPLPQGQFFQFLPGIKPNGQTEKSPIDIAELGYSTQFSRKQKVRMRSHPDFL